MVYISNKKYKNIKVVIKINTKKDLYFEMVDNLLVLMNNAKQMGYDLNIEEVAKVVGMDMNNLDRMDQVDMVLQLSINKLYQQSNVLFKTLIVNR